MNNCISNDMTNTTKQRVFNNSINPSKSNKNNNSLINNTTRLPDISNFKTSKFLMKFQSKISVTGNNGVADILSNTLNQNVANPFIKEKPSKMKNLQQWNEAVSECQGNNVNNYPEEVILFKKQDKNLNKDQRPNFQYQISKSLNKNKQKSIDTYYRQFKPFTLDDFKSKNFNQPVKLAKGLGSNIGSEEWIKNNNKREKLKEFAMKYKVKAKNHKLSPEENQREILFKNIKCSKLNKSKEFDKKLPPLNERKSKDYNYYSDLIDENEKNNEFNDSNHGVYDNKNFFNISDKFKNNIKYNSTIRVKKPQKYTNYLREGNINASNVNNNNSNIPTSSKNTSPYNSNKNSGNYFYKRNYIHDDYFDNIYTKLKNEGKYYDNNTINNEAYKESKLNNVSIHSKESNEIFDDYNKSIKTKDSRSKHSVIYNRNKEILGNRSEKYDNSNKYGENKEFEEKRNVDMGDIRNQIEISKKMLESNPPIKDKINKKYEIMLDRLKKSMIT